MSGGLDMREARACLAQCAGMLGNLNKRDKLTRLVDYSYRLRVYALSSGDDKVAQARASGTLSAIKSARKFFRFGKTLNFLQAIVQLQEKEKDAAVRVLGQLRALGYAGWMIYDAIVLLSQLGIVNGDVKKNVARGMKLWLFALVFAVALDLYKLSKCKEEAVTLKDSKLVAANQTKQRDLSLLLTRDIIDMAIPSFSLGWAPKLLVPNAGRAAMAGIVTSLICIYQEWPKRS